jgi:hypothetical protein
MAQTTGVAECGKGDSENEDSVAVFVTEQGIRAERGPLRKLKERRERRAAIPAVREDVFATFATLRHARYQQLCQQRKRVEEGRRRDSSPRNVPIGAPPTWSSQPDYFVRTSLP